MTYRHPVSQIQLDMYEKDTLAIKESLEVLLPRFDKIKDWSDVEKWLKRAKKLFSQKTSPFIPHKAVLFRRLASCLNPTLDVAVHQTVLEIYDIVLTNFKKEPNNIINDLHFITLGIFPYAQICTNNMKILILKIYKNHFIPLGYQLGPVIIALIGSLLPSLIDNNEQLRKEVFNFINSLSNIFPQSLIILAIWTNIKRSPKSRYGGFLYLNYLMMKEENVLNMSEGDEDKSISQDENDLIHKSNFEKKDNQKLVEEEIDQKQQIFKESLNDLAKIDKSPQKIEDLNIQKQEIIMENVDEIQQNQNFEKQNVAENIQEQNQNIILTQKNLNIQQNLPEQNLQLQNQSIQEKLNDQEQELVQNYFENLEKQENEQHDFPLEMIKDEIMEPYQYKTNENQQQNEINENQQNQEINENQKYLENNENFQQKEINENQQDQENNENLQHEENNENLQHEENNENLQHEENNENLQHEENNEKLQHEENNENLQHEENNENYQQLDIQVNYQTVEIQDNQQQKEIKENEQKNEFEENQEEKKKFSENTPDKNNQQGDQIPQGLTIEKLNQSPEQNDQTKQLAKNFDDEFEKVLENEENQIQKNIEEKKFNPRDSQLGESFQQNVPFDKFLETSENNFKAFVDSNKNIDIFFPRKDLCIEALSVSIIHENQLVKKKALDFILSFCNFEKEKRIFNNIEYIELIKYCLVALGQNDLGSRRRIFKFIFGPESDNIEDTTLPSEEILQMFYSAIKENLLNPKVEEKINIIKILQMIFMEQEKIIPVMFKAINSEIMNALILIQEKEEDQKQINSTVKRFFESIYSHFEYFIKMYVENEPQILDYRAFDLIISYIRNKEDLQLQMFILEGLVKIIDYQFQHVELKKQLKQSLKIINSFIENKDPFKFQQPEGTLKILLNQFLTSFHVFTDELKFQQKRNLKSLEQGLIFCIWILLLFKDKELIENWVIKIENLLAHVTKEPKLLLATIKGIQKLFSINQDDEAEQQDLTVLRNITESILNVTIKKSWELLDNVEFHGSAISLIFQLITYKSQRVFDLIEEGLFKLTPSISIKYLQRLVTFFKLAQSFELSIQQQELEKFVIFKLLEFLEDSHPIRRQISKSWLIDSNDYFQKIIDYLLIGLIQNGHFHFTLDNQILHYKKYDTKEVMKIYIRLKSLITNNQSHFTQFMNKNYLSDQLLIQMFNFMSNQDIKKNKFYYELVIKIIIRFMQASCIKVFSKSFKEDNILVKTSSCETLETLINCLTISNDKIVNRKLLDIILQTYYQNVEEGCSVMQIHLLNLLKLILFSLQSSEKFFLLKILKENELLKSVLESIKFAKNNYTLVKILDFIQKIVSSVAKEANQEDLLIIIEPIFNYYYDFYINYQTEKQLNQYSGKLIFSSCIAMVKEYCDLDNFDLKKKRINEGIGLIGVLTFQWKKKRIPKANHPLLENFFLKNLNKIIKLITISWYIVGKKSQYQAYNIGIRGVNKKDQQQEQDEKSKTYIKNEEFCEFVEKMFYKYTDKVFDYIIVIWHDLFQIYENNKYQKVEKNPELERIIDILLYLNIDIKEFNNMILESNFFKTILENQKKQQKNIINFKSNQKEASLLAIYYSFLRFKDTDFIEDKIERKNHLRNFWTNLLNFLKMFFKSNHPFTQIWIINILYMCARKYPVQEIISEYSIYRNLHNLENDCIENIVDFVSDKQLVEYEQLPLKDHRYGFVYPLAPKIINITLKDLDIFESKLFLQFPDQKYLHYFTKILSLYAIQKMSMPLLTSTYEKNKTHHIAKRIYLIIQKLFLELQKEKENSQMSEKINEEIIKLVFKFIQSQKNVLLQSVKGLIQTYFDSNAFFKVNSKGIKYLQSIIQCSLFTSKTQEKKVRFVAFHRLCFILYSGDKGTFLDKLTVKFLFEQIRDVIKKYSQDDILLIMLLFCIRIIILKSTEKVFVEMFPTIWPVLYNLISSVLIDDTQHQDLNLKLATLKLIEMLLLTNYDTFYMHYWCLGIDSPCFQTQEHEIPDLPSFISQFPFIPFFSKLIKKQVGINYYKFQDQIDNEYLERKKKKKCIVVKENKVGSEMDLSDIAYNLMISFTESNRMELEIDQEEVSEMILNDFIALNEFVE